MINGMLLHSLFQQYFSSTQFLSLGTTSSTVGRTNMQNPWFSVLIYRRPSLAFCVIDYSAPTPEGRPFAPLVLGVSWILYPEHIRRALSIYFPALEGLCTRERISLISVYHSLASCNNHSSCIKSWTQQKWGVSCILSSWCIQPNQTATLIASNSNIRNMLALISASVFQHLSQRQTH